ncbi:hypothetical protein CG419_03960 [Latilactobacillus curvatus]|uniref:LysM domain-containing protein n=1 Tax=Latilactobacillus curvatus TaxID=28038 RepID=A0AAC9UP88_LATCU|nr:bacterial Ig-like domain-containing protein [Latilactobacillus curvatus]ASN59830.1 hypothetical protein CG419_03960 [Latilactobacillus curvatus]
MAKTKATTSETDAPNTEEPVEPKVIVNVHDSTIYVGDKWSPKDNFDNATDADGKAVSLADISVDSAKVDVTTSGKYGVTYTYADVSAIATVTVKDDLTDIKVHDSTLSVGDHWEPAYNFDSATDKDGKQVGLDKLTVDTTKVDLTSAGVYEVKYALKAVTVVATVSVEGKPEPIRDSYKVQAGDDIATIATTHNVSVGWVKYVNNLSSNRLKVGKVLYFDL